MQFHVASGLSPGLFLGRPLYESLKDTPETRGKRLFGCGLAPHTPPSVFALTLLPFRQRQVDRDGDRDAEGCCQAIWGRS